MVQVRPLRPPPKSVPELFCDFGVMKHGAPEQKRSTERCREKCLYKAAGAFKGTRVTYIQLLLLNSSQFVRQGRDLLTQVRVLLTQVLHLVFGYLAVGDVIDS